MALPITAFLPCRRGSERVKSKNTRPFGGSSLVEIKLAQLLAVSEISTIIVSTDDPVVMDVAREFNNERICIMERPKYFASSQCSTDDLIHYVIQMVPFECLLWTHATSPFFTSQSYMNAIKVYEEQLKNGYDSLATVDCCREFIWDAAGNSVNYDREAMGNWPRTQLVDPLYIINSAAFIATRGVMERCGDRLGEKPFLLMSNRLEGFDIDWEEDFYTGEKLWISLSSDIKLYA